MGIRGPRSALSQFLESENIKVEKPESSPQIKEEKEQVIAPKPTRKNKRLKFSHPTEIVNFRGRRSVTEILLQKIHANIFKFKLNDDQIEEYANFLFEKLSLTQEIFDHISECASEKFTIRDCSMIKSFDKIKNLKHLYLGYCGQLKNSSMKQILDNNPDLETLHISGAFLLEDLDLSKHRKLQNLNVKDCSRLTNTFMDNLNTHSTLKYLNISHCFRINRKAKLNINLQRLSLDRVHITKKFFKSIDLSQIEDLSIGNCPFLFKNGKNRLKLKNFTALKKLNIEGISEIPKIKNRNLEELRASNCFPLVLPPFQKHLRYLDVSNCNLTEKDLSKILNYSNLEYLNISFNPLVDDKFVLKAIKKFKNIREIVVFGCFLLSEDLGDLAWKIKDSIKIVGNHSETKFLLES